MKTITVVATFEARPGREAALKNALTGLLAPTRGESGCVNYDLHQSTEHAGKFLFYETWTGKEALDAHLQKPHLQALLSRMDELCAASPEIKIYRKIP